MKNETPLSAFLQHPVTLAFTQVLLPLVTVGLIVLFFWLDAGVISKISTLTLSLMGGFSLITAGYGVWSIYKPAHRMPQLVVSAMLNALAFFGLLLLADHTNDVFDAELPLWLGEDVPIVFLIIIAYLTVLQCSAGALIAKPLPCFKNKLTDFGCSFFAFLCTIGSAFLIVLILDACHAWTSYQLEEYLFFALIFVLVAEVFHLLGLLSAAHQLAVQRIPFYNASLRVLCVGIFPLVALVANSNVPIPFNMQTPWCYALVILFSLSILLPTCKVTAFVRWMTLPFTLYFFFLFLPFIPFIVILLLCFGIGALLLIPIFIFWQHLQALRECTLPKWCIALALSILPIGFLLITECDRIVTRTLIEHLSTPDYTTGKDTLPMSEAQARTAAHTIYLYEHGDRIPFLSRWRDFRLFDSLHPRQEVMDALIARYGRPETMGFGHRWTPRRSIPQKSELSPTLTFNTPEQRHVTLHLTIPQDDGKEFRSPFSLAEGVWITGMRLQLPDGTWKTATLRDRRAATWMYRDIVEKQLDPALLTLDTHTFGNLRVFPLTCERHVEIDLLLPEANWATTPFALGERVTLPVAKPSPDPRTVARICFISEGTAPEGYDLYVMGQQEITVQAERPTEALEFHTFNAKRALRFAYGYAYAHNLRLGEATFHGEGWDDIQSSYHPEAARAPLPKLSPDDPWQLGAQMWQLAEAMAHNQTLDYRKEINAMAKTCGVLTPTNAYIVVETEQQERQLAATDLGVKRADLAFDVYQTEDNNGGGPLNNDAPSTLLLLLLFLFVLSFLVRMRRLSKHPLP